MERIGKLKERVTIKRNTATGNNSFGEPSESFTTYFTAWARARPLAGKEVADRSLTFEEHPVEFTLRWRSDKTPTPAMKAVWQSQDYDIKSVSELEAARRFWLVLGVRSA